MALAVRPDLSACGACPPSWRPRKKAKAEIVSGVCCAPLIVSHGSLESPEYQRHARDFAAAVRAAGKPVQLLIGEGYNHFEVIETLGNPYGLLGRAVLEQMRLTAA